MASEGGPRYNHLSHEAPLLIRRSLVRVQVEEPPYLPVLDDRFMDMSAEEIKQFWRGFCQRRKIAADVIAKGDAIIEKDPDYWADQTMGDLLDSITTGKKPS